MSKRRKSAHTQKALLMRTQGASFNTIAKDPGFSKGTVIHNLKNLIQITHNLPLSCLTQRLSSYEV